MARLAKAAVKLAAQDARRQILETAAQLWHLTTAEVRLANRQVYAKGRTSMTIVEVVQQC